MSRQTFLEFITNEQYQSQVVSNGTVQNAATPTPIPSSPIGWNDNEVQWVRKQVYYGILKSFVTNLTFVEEAAQIIRYYLYRTGIDTVLYYIITKMDQAFGAGLVHNGWYKGKFALSSAKDGDLGVQVNLEEGGFYKDFEARRSTPYEYPLKDDFDVCSLENDGMEIENNVKFGVSDGTLTSNNGNHEVDLNKLSEETVSEVSSSSAERVHFNDNNELRTNGTPFLQTGSTSTGLAMEWDFNVVPTLAPGISANPFAGASLVLRWFNTGGDNTAVGSFVLQTFGGPLTTDYDFYNRNQHLKGSQNVTIPPGMDVYLVIVSQIGNTPISGAGADEIFFTYSNSIDDYFKIKYNYRFPTTIMDVLRAIDLGKKLHRSASDGLSDLDSTMLENDQNLLVTCGDCIRGLPGSIKTKLEDFIKSIDAVRCISYGIENNNGKIESREYAFDDTTQITDLGEAKLPDTDYISSANEFLYNLIRMGYPTKDIGKVNGRYSFNNTTVWGTPEKSESNIYEQISVYLADPFLIELFRINVSNKTSTDDSSDNDVFFLDGEKVFPDLAVQSLSFFHWIDPDMGQININGVTGLNLYPGVRFRIPTGYNAGTYVIANVFEDSGNTIIYINDVIFTIGSYSAAVEFRHYKLRRIAYDSITGIIFPLSVYNLELSPGRMFRAHQRWIHSSMDDFESGTITFQTTDKNADLVTTLGSDVIAEKADIQISNLGPKIFKPKYLNFEVETPFNLTELMDANPRGFFLYQENGVNRKGFTMDIKTTPETLETQTYKLLSLPDNDFTNRK